MGQGHACLGIQACLHRRMFCTATSLALANAGPHSAWTANKHTHVRNDEKKTWTRAHLPREDGFDVINSKLFGGDPVHPHDHVPDLQRAVALGSAAGLDIVNHFVPSLEKRPHPQPCAIHTACVRTHAVTHARAHNGRHVEAPHDNSASRARAFARSLCFSPSLPLVLSPLPPLSLPFSSTLSISPCLPASLSPSSSPLSPAVPSLPAPSVTIGKYKARVRSLRTHTKQVQTDVLPPNPVNSFTSSALSAHARMLTRHITQRASVRKGVRERVCVGESARERASARDNERARARAKRSKTHTQTWTHKTLSSCHPTCHTLTPISQPSSSRPPSPFLTHLTPNSLTYLPPPPTPSLATATPLFPLTHTRPHQGARCPISDRQSTKPWSRRRAPSSCPSVPRPVCFNVRACEKRGGGGGKDCGRTNAQDMKRAHFRERNSEGRANKAR